MLSIVSEMEIRKSSESPLLFRSSYPAQPGLTEHGRSPLPRSSVSDSPLSTVLSYLILLGGLSIIVVTGYMVVVSYSRLPFAESWLQISIVAQGGSPVSLGWLWQQHLEHRFPIPKLFLAVDLWLFHASQKFLLASTFTIQLLHLMLLGWSMRALGGWRGALWRTGFGLAAFCLFFPSQWETFVFSFEVIFVLSVLFASLSFIALLLYWLSSQQPAAGQKPWIFLLLSILAALGATFSLANGNLVWPLLVAAALLLRLSLSAILLLIISGTAGILTYFHHYISPPGSVSLGATIQAPARTLEYLATYLGASWTTTYNRSAMFYGIAGLVLLLCLIPRFRLPVGTSRVFSVELLLILMFCLGTAGVTALGRTSSGLDQAFSSRYQTFALLFWWALLMLLLLPWFRGSRAQFTTAIAQACLLGIMLGGIHLAGDAVRKARVHGFELDVAAIALMTDTPDRAQLQHIYPDPDYLWQLLPYMREKRLSIFAGNPAPRMGERLDSGFRLVSSEQCVGAMQSVQTVGGGASTALKITGWAWDRKHQRPPPQIVAASNGVIVGLGAVGDWRPNIRAANPYLKTSFVGFTGYVKNVQPAAALSLYAIFDSQPPEACTIATLTPGVP